MIREERRPEWWQAIAAHPGVARHVGGTPEALAAMIGSPLVQPLASQSGGFLFVKLDALGRVYELHTLFLPNAWGTREIVEAAHAAFRVVFATAQLVTTFEQAAWSRSRPPITHGWQAAGDFEPSPIGPVKTWVLTLNAWRNSPAVRRRRCRLL